MVSVGFLLFILFTSNPFSRTLPNFPIEGRDLNPLLQDPGLIFHPPLLYMGYVGFSVAFAFVIASLLSGRLDSTYARFTRPWTLAAWIFLTLGIVLGSAWAYYELGWGGWWFWDPVENASFMPWLVGTALMHSLAVTEQRASFKAWTLLLAISAFSLCLLGTFLVRSGVLVSVHAFASDPARGMFILAFMVLVIGGSLLLFAARGHKVKSPRKPLMTEQRIGQNTQVTLHFALRLENGDTVDSTFDKSPATFKVGDGSLLPGFEAALFGFKAGDKRTLEILPENAFGQPNPQNVQIIPRSQFKDMELSQGLLVIFNDAANTELPGVVKAFDDEQVTIDFNHPLAGKTLTFDVEIKDVQAL